MNANAARQPGACTSTPVSARRGGSTTVRSSSAIASPGRPTITKVARQPSSSAPPGSVNGCAVAQAIAAPPATIARPPPTEPAET